MSIVCRRVRAFLFDGGTLTAADALAVRVRDREISAWRFFEAEDARDEMREGIWHRLRTALDSLERGTTSYLERAP